MTLLRRWSREPLVHFVALGMALFAFHRWVAPTATPKRIELSESMVDGLRRDYLRRTGALPTEAEERALVDQFIDNEVLYREALAMGLDRGDIIVRRRLIQKMEFLTEDEESVAAPTDAELTAYRDAHAERYTLPERVSVEQVFVSVDRHGRETEAVAAELHRRLVAGADPAGLGDPFVRGRAVTQRSESELAGVFGASFATQVMALPLGSWSPPLRSSYGWHLVRVNERVAGGMASLAEIRTTIVRDWRAQRRREASRAALDRLRRGYAIDIERPAEAIARQ
ncbi:MAG TPA: peptidylprolyl isomerase [Candidatus Kryptonia bacterium]|nr:peptidylprolyl isomerase [Candidatus Kryptonia bacterium]